MYICMYIYICEQTFPNTDPDWMQHTWNMEQVPKKAVKTFYSRDRGDVKVGLGWLVNITPITIVYGTYKIYKYSSWSL